ncbi:MAG: hypothetical protein ABIT36_05375 [Steroidobacteraceae bacterium]
MASSSGGDIPIIVAPCGSFCFEKSGPILDNLYRLGELNFDSAMQRLSKAERLQLVNRLQAFATTSGGVRPPQKR